MKSDEEAGGGQRRFETGTETVLLVEDDAFVRAFATMCLESFGYTVIVAVDGREALARLNEGLNVDLLFSDVVMPGGISGIDLAERARELRPGLKVLLTSGYSAEALSPAGDRYGVPLKKPYRKAELARRLRAVLDKPND